MTGYRPGDVVLVPYPFGYGAGGRKRPALVVSGDGYNQGTGELVIAQITSRISAPPRQGDYRIEEWREAKLPRPALVRARLAGGASVLWVTHDGEQGRRLARRRLVCAGGAVSEASP